MGNLSLGLRNVVSIDEPIKVGNGEETRAFKKGSLPLSVFQEDGSFMEILLDDYKYSPNLDVNLFSITKALSKGWKLSNDGVKLILTKNNAKLIFDKVLHTKDGVLCGIDMLTRTDEKSYLATTESRTSAVHEGKLITSKESVD